MPILPARLSPEPGPKRTSTQGTPGSTPHPALGSVCPGQGCQAVIVHSGGGCGGWGRLPEVLTSELALRDDPESRPGAPCKEGPQCLPESRGVQCAWGPGWRGVS